MNRCPITYEDCGDKLYSAKGLKQLSRNLNSLKPFPYTSEEQINESINRASKLSIQGVQPKLSVKLNIHGEVFEIVDRKGTYILKPQHSIYKEVPQNEDLTMKLAKEAGLEVPLHGMIYSKDGSLTYFIKRFDRTPWGNKYAVEDFAQLEGLTRETKYNSSMEKVVKVIDTYCTFPQIEKIRLFEIVVFNFLTGNEDSHLKNFSLITKDNLIRLTPCYDLLNTSIIMPVKEEIALPVKGKKRNLNPGILIDYFGSEICKINAITMDSILSGFASAIKKWEELINLSFLSAEMKRKYSDFLDERKQILGLGL